MKRILCLILTLTLAGGAFAAAVREDTVVQTVRLLGVMNGDTAGNLNLDQPVTRAQFTKMVVCASALKDRASAVSDVSPFPDVRSSHWAAGYVAAAVASGWVNGYRSGKFLPDNPVTLEEAANIVLKLLGYGAADFAGAYPDAQLTQYRALGLDENIDATRGQTLSRRACMYLIYNALGAKTKAGQVYCTTLGHATDKDGRIDTLALLEKKLDGPLVVRGTDWAEALPFSLSDATVYRGGGKADSSGITTYDVVYYAEGLRTLWVYSDKVTGVLEAASPNKIAPSSVTLSGKTYSLSGEAPQALSAFGDVTLGSTVTLLLGKNGEAVGVAAGAGAAGESYGVITAVTTRTYTQPNGGTYTQKVIRVLDTAGSTTDYPTDSKSFAVGGIVRVTRGDTVKITGVSAAGLTGPVTKDGVGGKKFSSDVEILDVCEGRGARVYPERIAGVTLASGDVLFYAKNAAGEVSRLILKDVTGDLDEYGIVTDINKTESDYATTVSYTCDIGGAESVLTNVRAGNVITYGGVARRVMQDGTVRLTSLTSINLATLSDASAAAGNTTWPVAPNAAVYVVKGGKYYLSNVSAVQSGYRLTGYYDAPGSRGGRIRVIIAGEE